jgi:hypothetical protein
MYALTPSVVKKLKNVRAVASRNVLSTVLIFKFRPPSKRIMTRVSAGNIVPNIPKLSVLTNPRTGPIRMPRSIRSSRSGILVRMKIRKNRCPRNIRTPIKRMYTPTSVIQEDPASG